MRRKFIRVLLVLLIAAVNIGCDQATKYIARQTLRGRGTVMVVKDFFILHYVENEGAFLSFGSRWPETARQIFFTAVPAIMISALLVYILTTKHIRTAHLVAYSCIIGGGMGNIIDRLIYNGRVADFMNLGIGSVRTGIFNFADLSVLLGAAILVFTLREKKTARETADADDS